MAAWQLTRTAAPNGGAANNKCARQTKKMWYGNHDQIIKWARLMKML
jgi:hypothetical protein